jgi:Mn2+/Fe2+ NRAMP family transporter
MSEFRKNTEPRIVATPIQRENACLREETAINIAVTLQGVRSRLGPGLLFAAAAVGTSHLVQSTRAGAAFGLTLGALIIAVCVLKYPLFRFAADYAAATGESLVAGYRRQGRLLVGIMFIAAAIEAIAAVAGVSLVTAGIARWLFNLPGTDLHAALGILLVTGALVAFGRYRLLESFTTVFVVVFSLLVVFATAASLPVVLEQPLQQFPAFPVSTENLSFATAVAGWMPIGNTAAIMLAGWILAKPDSIAHTRLAIARFDFNLGYLTSIVLALCFLVMGTAALHGRSEPLPTGGAAYTAVFVDMFAGTIGELSRIPVAVAALTVMYSTLLAITDGFPRMLQSFLAELGLSSKDSNSQRRHYLALMAVVILTAAILLTFFLRSFTDFIDLVTIIGFIAAPAIAWANYLVIRGSNVPVSARPGRTLRWWSHAAVVALLVASSSFLYFRFFS